MKLVKIFTFSDHLGLDTGKTIVKSRKKRDAASFLSTISTLDHKNRPTGDGETMFQMTENVVIEKNDKKGGKWTNLP